MEQKKLDELAEKLIEIQLIAEYKQNIIRKDAEESQCLAVKLYDENTALQIENAELRARLEKAVEVVRCKDCKYRNDYSCLLARTCVGCGKLSIYTDGENGFCQYGTPEKRISRGGTREGVMHND